MKANKFITAGTLKLIAVFLMIIDHGFSGYFERFGDIKWLEYVVVIATRGAFVIYIFLICEGLKHTRSRINYFLRLLAFGFISEVPADIWLFNK